MGAFTMNEAIALLRGHGGWIAWDPALDEPQIVSGQITLDGQFSKAELQALVACFQGELDDVTKNESAAERNSE